MVLGRGRIGLGVIVAMLAIGCSSVEVDSVEVAPADVVVTSVPPPALVAPMGPMSQRLTSDAPDATATAFLSAWAAGDFHSVAVLFDLEARREIARALNALDLRWLAGPPRHLQVNAVDGAFSAAPGSSAFLGEVLAAIHASGASPIDLGRSVRSIESTAPGDGGSEVLVTFESGPAAALSLVDEAGTWRVRRIQESGADPETPVLAAANPTSADPALQWCGAENPVVFAGVDCGRVQAGQAGLTDEETAAVAELRAAAIEDPTQALELTQRMQAMLASAPGQLCRLMQRGEVPAGDAQIAADELAATVCPFSTAIDLGMVDHAAWRYGELDLASPESTVRALVDAYDRRDWYDLSVLAGPGGLADLHRSINNLDAAALVSDAPAIAGPIDLHPDPLVDLFERSDPLLVLTGPVEEIEMSADGSTAEVRLPDGSVWVAFETAPDGRWRVRAISSSASIDPTGSFFQP